jgi:hypothetical protein
MVDSLLYQFKSRPQSQAARSAIRGEPEIRNKSNALGKRARWEKSVGWNNDLNRWLSGHPSGDLLLYPLRPTSMLHGCDSYSSLEWNRGGLSGHSLGASLL